MEFAGINPLDLPFEVERKCLATETNYRDRIHLVWRIDHCVVIDKGPGGEQADQLCDKPHSNGSGSDRYAAMSN